MEAINDLSDISDSESFEESKYDHQSSKKHKRKHSKTKRTREEKSISLSGDSDLEERIVGTFTDCNPAVVYQEKYSSKSSSEKRSSRYKSRKYHKREKDLPARDPSASSISSNESNENHYRKKNNSHHRRRHKDSDKEDIGRKRLRDSQFIKDENEENSQQRTSYSEGELEGVDLRSGGSRSKRHKSRHKHSTRHRHRRRTSAERQARRLVRKQRRRRSRSLGSSGSSAAEERLHIGQVVKNEPAAVGGNSPNDVSAPIAAATVREPDASQWDETATSNIRSNHREETVAGRVKSEPPSGSESDERPFRPSASGAGGGNRHRDERRDGEGPGALRQNRENEGRPANRNGSHQNGREVWGVAEPAKEEKEPEEKVKPNLGLSGKLTEDANTYKGVVIKYSQPPEARKPKRRWRWYIFKGEEELPFLPLHRQSAYLIGRERRVVDVPTDHPSCSKQHAVLQYRLVRYTRDDGTVGRTVKPYIIDLESANGTYVNNRRITSRSYVELLEKDVVKFGYSSREYVLLHETSKDSDADTADAGLDMSPVSALMSTAMAGQ